MLDHARRLALPGFAALLLAAVLSGPAQAAPVTPPEQVKCVTEGVADFVDYLATGDPWMLRSC